MQDCQFRSGDISEDVVAQIAIVLCTDGRVEVRWAGDISALLSGTSPEQLNMAMKTIIGMQAE
ncbi:hypothetical protein [Aquitalea sp. ASV11]|uniref:hypothetical protein n=1 Tax=Aquitalea sp. ASV11 TaxID=2795103 RepID=UPI0018EB750F|nr:hypothetical protein [Aquitalea sp. ASV11]